MRQLKKEVQVISEELKGVTKDADILMKTLLRSLKTASNRAEKLHKTVERLEKVQASKKRETKAAVRYGTRGRRKK